MSKTEMEKIVDKHVQYAKERIKNVDLTYSSAMKRLEKRFADRKKKKNG